MVEPCDFYKKKDESIRFFIDLRRVNHLVELDEFALPNIQKIVRSLKDMAISGVINLEDGYFQVNLKKEDREKTAFLYGRNRLMQFKKMPQGFKNSPAIFQRGMQHILEGLLEVCCFCYIDDILIFGKEREEHNANVKKVPDRLNEFNLVVNEKKSRYNMEEVDFLGYNIRKDHIRFTLDRTQGIMAFEI